MGLQMMIEAQCEALVEKFNVKPLICGIVGPIWLRFVASTGVFDDGWVDEAIHQSEIKKSATRTGLWACGIAAFQKASADFTRPLFIAVALYLFKQKSISRRLTKID